MRNTEDLEVPPQLRDRVQMLTDLDYQARCCGALLAACLLPHWPVAVEYCRLLLCLLLRRWRG